MTQFVVVVKKFYVYVKNEKGNVIKVSFGDTTGLSIKRDDFEDGLLNKAKWCDNRVLKQKQILVMLSMESRSKGK